MTMQIWVKQWTIFSFLSHFLNKTRLWALEHMHLMSSMLIKPNMHGFCHYVDKNYDIPIRPRK